MKKCILTAIVMAFTMSFVPQSADAQFFKKLGKAIGNAVSIEESTTDTRSNSSTEGAMKSDDSADKGKAKYQLHTTGATKTIVIRGGASRLFQFSCGVAVVEHRNGWFVIDKQGNKLFDLPEDYHPVGDSDPKNARFYNDRLFICKSVNYSGVDVKIINKQGNIVKELGMAQEIYAPVDGIARMAVRNGFRTQFYYINMNGEKVGLQTPVSEVYSLVEGVRCFKDPDTDKWGYCDANMNIVVPAKLRDAGAMHRGLAQAQNSDGLWGFVNKSGAWAIQPQFSIPPGAFKGPYARVYDRQGVTYFMDQNGKFAWKNPNPQDTKCHEYLPEGYCIWTMYNDSIAPAYAPIHIVDASFNKVGVIDRRVIDMDPSGEAVSSNAQWFQWYQHYETNMLFDWKGNLLLKFDGNGVFSDGICSAYIDNIGNLFYFNEKGEIIVKFEDTQF